MAFDFGKWLDSVFNPPKYEDPTEAYVAAHGGQRDMNAERSSAWWKLLYGDPNAPGVLNPTNFTGAMDTANANAAHAGQQAVGVSQDALRAAQAYDPQAAWKWLQEQNPTLQQNALDFAKKAYGLYDTSYRDLANQQSAQGVQSVADALAGTGLINSGSGLTAMTDASTKPQLEYLNAITQAMGQAANALYGSQWGTAYGQQSAENQFAQNGLMNAYGGSINALGNLAGIYSDAAGRNASLAQVLAQLLGQAGEQVLIPPSIVENPNYLSTSDIFNTVGSGISTALGLAGMGGMGGTGGTGGTLHIPAGHSISK